MDVSLVWHLLSWFGVGCFFFFNDTATTEIYTLSLHDALPICCGKFGGYVVKMVVVVVKLVMLL